MNSRLPRHLEIAFWDALIHCMIQLQTWRIYRLVMGVRPNLHSFRLGQPRRRWPKHWAYRSLGATLLGLIIGFLYGVVAANF